jgi:predicted nucleic acid-binding protein
MALPLIVEPIAAEAVVRAGAMARTHGLSVYDATYLDLAARRGLALATFDAALARAAAAQGIETVVR